MRTIKFRGKRLDNGEWIYGSYVPHYDFFGTIKDEMIDENGYLFEADPATVGQYTGFQDKNTREVYEGDVLTDKFESLGVIEWQNGCFVVNFGDVDVFQISDCFDDSYQMWVIGNIHDNPELLKEGEQ